MTEPTLDELAKQGNTDAIAALLNRVLAPRGVTAKAAIKNDCLNIVVEAVETPNKQECVALVRNVITRLQLGQVEAVTVYGRQPGDDIPDWHQKFLLEDGKAQAEESSPFAAFTKMVGGIGESISNTTSQAGKAIVETATGVGEVVGKTTLGTGKVVVDTASGVGKAVVETATGLGGAMAGVGGAIGSNASQAVKTAAGVGGTAAKRTYQILSQITEFVAGAPILRKVVDQVDLVKAENAVKTLKGKHPHETPRQIAHRIMVEKAIYAGGSGLVTSLVPGAAAALFAVDLAATSALQAEMVYQIAAAYGFDIRDPARRGEVLTVFGLALGGNQAIRAGLEFLQNAPVAGAAIGASTNAVMLYTVGYAACRFYEAKLNAEGTEASLAESKEATEAYLQTAIAQQIVMDQILVHVIIAGNPEKSWEDIVPELEALKINPASLAVIKHHINSPPPLERLLAQLNHDFAIPLLAQCQQVAQQDRITTLQEAKVIETIAQKFDIDLKVMQEQLVSN